jgi:hypothetical protein
MTEDLMDILAAMKDPGQPDTMFREIDARTKSLVGHQLFTLLYVDGDEVARIYSNRPAEYPVSGRKPMGKTPWGDLVLKARKPFLGRSRDDIRWAFFDHALIESMGLGCAICVPVVYNGECLGTMNLLDAEHHYRDEHVPLVARLAPLLVPAFLEARRSAA